MLRSSDIIQGAVEILGVRECVCGGLRECVGVGCGSACVWGAGVPVCGVRECVCLYWELVWVLGSAQAPSPASPHSYLFCPLFLEDSQAHNLSCSVNTHCGPGPGRPCKLAAEIGFMQEGMTNSMRHGAQQPWMREPGGVGIWDRGSH